MSPVEGFIGLGSNLGDPPAQISLALQHLAECGIQVDIISSLYRTEPVDAPSQPWFTNAVAKVLSPIGPHELLGVCLEIEKRQGRKRSGRPFHEARILDLDLLMVGVDPIFTAELTLPHPRLHLRRFVLVPLAEIAPRWVHPTLGLSAKGLLDQCRDPASVVRFASPPSLRLVGSR